MRRSGSVPQARIMMTVEQFLCYGLRTKSALARIYPFHNGLLDTQVTPPLLDGPEVLVHGEREIPTFFLKNDAGPHEVF